MHLLKSMAQVATVSAALVFASQTYAKPLRVVYLQGFKSCTNQKNEPVREFFEASKHNPDAKMYWGCFDGAFLDHPLDAKEYFWLYTTDGKGNWSKPERIEGQLAPQVIASRLTQDLRNIYPEFDREDRPINPESKMDLFISGHSHGGWMAMRVAYYMSFRPEIELQELLTLDPVSFKLCSSQAFPGHLLRSIAYLRLYSTTPDCHRSPRDLEPLYPAIAKAAKGRWVNHYQTTMPFLSSGPISHTLHNYEFEADTRLDWFTAHLAMLVSPNVWQDYNRRLNAIARRP